MAKERKEEKRATQISCVKQATKLRYRSDTLALMYTAIGRTKTLASFISLYISNEKGLK